MSTPEPMGDTGWLQWILGGAGSLILLLLGKLHMGQIEMAKELRAELDTETGKIKAEHDKLWEQIGKNEDRTTIFRESMLTHMATKNDLKNLEERLIGEIRRK